MKNTFRSACLMAAGTVAVAALTSCSASSSGEGASAATDKSGTLFAKLPGDIQKSGKIRVAADAHPPYRTVAPNGDVTGIDADFWKAVEKELGVNVAFESAASLPAILTGLDSGRYDAYNGPLAASPDREKQLDMVSWMQEKISYVYNADAGINDISGVCGKKVAHGVGNIVEQMLPKLGDWCEQQGLDAPQAMPLKDTSATILALSSGQADIAAMTQSAALDLLKAQKGKYDYVTQDEAQGSMTFQDCVVTPKDSGLAPVLQEAVQRMFDNGSYDALIKKWGLEDVKIDKSVLNPGA